MSSKSTIPSLREWWNLYENAFGLDSNLYTPYVIINELKLGEIRFTALSEKQFQAIDLVLADTLSEFSNLMLDRLAGRIKSRGYSQMQTQNIESLRSLCLFSFGLKESIKNKMGQISLSDSDKVHLIENLHHLRRPSSIDSPVQKLSESPGIVRSIGLQIDIASWIHIVQINAIVEKWYNDYFAPLPKEICTMVDKCRKIDFLQKSEATYAEDTNAIDSTSIESDKKVLKYDLEKKRFWFDNNKFSIEEIQSYIKINQAQWYFLEYFIEHKVTEVDSRRLRNYIREKINYSHHMNHVMDIFRAGDQKIRRNFKEIASGRKGHPSIFLHVELVAIS